MLRNLLNRATSALRFRRRALRLGLHTLASRPGRLEWARIAGRPVRLSFPPGEEAVLTHEFAKLFLEDCYGLERVSQEVGTVLDVGANVGLFGLAARHRFRRAKIHCYEPNPVLTRFLLANTLGMDITPFSVAVGTQAGSRFLAQRGNSLHSVVSGTEGISVSQVSLPLAISRLGGSVDLLKLDCEGSEWELLDEPMIWNGVREVTMEYHLWARPGAVVGDVTSRLESMGFVILAVEPARTGNFGLLRARRHAR